MGVGGYVEGQGRIGIDRVFEYTSPEVEAAFRQDTNVLFDQLQRLPCLFMEEGRNGEIARLGSVSNVRVVGRDVVFDSYIDPDLPALRNLDVYNHKLDFDMPQDWEFSRNHWAVKSGDLFRSVLKVVRPIRQGPRIFSVPDNETIDRSLLTVMMPFREELNPVMTAVVAAAERTRMQAYRADQPPQALTGGGIVQETVRMIDQSKMVVCDLTGNNPNVLYEVGIAHTLGRDVQLIAQSISQVPFDLLANRVILYTNTTEGLANLTESLVRAISDLP